MKSSTALFGFGLLAVGVALGWGGGWATSSTSEGDAAIVTRQVIAERPSEHSGNVDIARLTAQMRRLVREELSALDQKSLGCDHLHEEDVTEPEDTALDAERDASLKLAMDIVDAAIGGGEWTLNDRQDVRAVWSTLDQNRRAQVLSKLLGAFNDGTLRSTTAGPPI